MAAGVAGGTALGICSVLIFPCCLPCAIAACVVPAVSAATPARESRCRIARMCLRQRYAWQHMVLPSVVTHVHPVPPPLLLGCCSSRAACTRCVLCLSSAAWLQLEAGPACMASAAVYAAHVRASQLGCASLPPPLPRLCRCPCMAGQVKHRQSLRWRLPASPRLGQRRSRSVWLWCR